MGTRLRQAILLLSVAVGLFTGGWAGFAPHSFYSSFPGLTHAWVAVDGPYNEHLIRDVGALYLGLAAGGIVALLLKDPSGSRVLGGAWLVFGALHVGYHAQHLDLLDPIDAWGTLLALAGCLAFALLLLPARRRPAADATAGRHEHLAASR
ncbi:hypothetical protein [Naasia aerilata]|uniref:DUF4383 domain-containing protein n=1 Tax=Naasia aerilata TaxID=1162966 RepID=A0ABN6XHV0_9MICO|nr:hypothetical protein [Naasia aerilata]BDZ44424.1 hypothetical protein GCM10025866_03330 [Naasia aerilata]